MEKFGAGIEELRGAGDGDDEKCGDRVKGPWSPEEDTILSRLVADFGARNWSLITRGIPGRSGKSYHLRWCNQLDPAVKRKPFTGQSFILSHFTYSIIEYWYIWLLSFINVYVLFKLDTKQLHFY
ncbi:putative transcription factor MYB-HB-like family [Helianthus annuus]|nr:putative transcription factor MYB-HB-like family [Helianthus annuus]